MDEGIRAKVSRFLDILIPEGKWEEYLELLDRNGIPNRKQTIGLLLIICQQIEKLENDYKQLKQPPNGTRPDKNVRLQPDKG
jgi:hypothetical protein